jgi:spermidine/putrescine transport system permease protein
MKARSPFRIAVLTLIWAWMALFVLAPSVLVTITSVLERDEVNFVRWTFSLDSYQRLFDPLYLQVLSNSLLLAGIATLGCLLVGYPFAFAVSRLQPRTKTLLILLMMVPFWTNSLVRTFAVKMLIATRGLLNEILLGLGLIERPLQMLYTDGAVVLGLVYVMLPFMVLPLYAVFEDLREDLLQASSDLGAKPWQTFRHITLPLTMPGIIAGTLLVFLPSLGCFYVTDVLGGARVLLAGNVIKNQFLDARDWPFGASASILLSALMGILLIAYRYSARSTPSRSLGV